MEGVGVDLFATKGIEYLIVIVYLAGLLGLWRLLAGPGARTAPATRDAWAAAPDGVLFHQGHAWAAPTSDAVARVGVDGFAGRLLGPPARVRLPDVGAELRQGEPAWTLEVDGEAIDMLSPVDGEVVEVNPRVRDDPAAVVADPYRDGWLLEVAVPRMTAARKNLLSGPVASAWLRQSVERLRSLPAGPLGVVMTDGGAPVPGFARLVAPDAWGDLARELLLSGPDATAAPAEEG
jgi:glycine cleavage system H lipoate-binding protein